MSISKLKQQNQKKLFYYKKKKLVQRNNEQQLIQKFRMVSFQIDRTRQIKVIKFKHTYKLIYKHMYIALLYKTYTGDMIN